MMREINTNQLWACEPLTDAPTATTLETWMAGQVGYLYALAHADDGVIWGKWVNGQWAWSSGVIATSPQLQAMTLQQLRLFGAQGELLLWRTATGFAGRTILDGVGTAGEFFDEPQRLWGLPDGEPKGGFQPMREGAQGLRHAPPQEIALAGILTARNYIAYDQEGCAYVQASRLIAVN